MNLKNKVIVFLLIFVAIITMFSQCFAIVFSTKGNNLVEVPDLPVQDFDRQFPGRDYFCYVVKINNVVYSRIFILQPGLHFRIFGGSSLEVVDTSGSIVVTGCTKYYLNQSDQKWYLTENVSGNVGLTFNDDFAYLTNQNILHKDTGKTVFSPTPTNLLFLQHQGGTQVQEGVVKNLQTLIPVGLTILLSLLLVYLIASKRWL